MIEESTLYLNQIGALAALLELGLVRGVHLDRVVDVGEQGRGRTDARAWSPA